MIGHHENEPTQLLRFLTAGSVDDGKSTLIGRLLYDSAGVYEDQLAAIRSSSTHRNGGLDLSLITDGLRAEREQGITIDVAYRYFATPKRQFIIADVPGHEQYTRNMATGASTAEATVLLVDATRGIRTQTRRHAHIASLMGIAHLIVAVNKMDLLDFDQGTFLRLCRTLEKELPPLGFASSTFIPVSAVCGDNVVSKSGRTAWYEGPSLLKCLEELPAAVGVEQNYLRLPIQLVLRSQDGFRGYAGQIASGSIEKGQKILSTSSVTPTQIASITLGGKELAKASAPMSVVVALQDELDVGRGDMLVDADHSPACAQRFRAKLIWLSETPLKLQEKFFLKQTSHTVCGSVEKIFYRIDIDTLGQMESDTLALNDIGEVQIDTHRPIFCDPYSANRSTGSFILIRASDNSTAAAGMVSSVSVTESRHEKKPIDAGAVVWFTGLSGAGKTTITEEVFTELLARNYRVEMLDGDVIRKNLNTNLGFSKKDRDENIRRIGYVASLLAKNGVVVLVSAISPYRDARTAVRNLFDRFIEVFVNAPLAVCEERDRKGLYKKARAGLMSGFTGIDDPYEPPLSPEVECKTDQESVKESVEKVLSAIFERVTRSAASPVLEELEKHV